MRAFHWVICMGLGLGVSAAHADVKLHNKDSKAHDITVKCKSSTVQRSIQAGTVTTIGKGPCEVTVKSTGAKMAADGDVMLTIEKPKK